MSAETACRIMSSGEENYVSSRQERIGLFFASIPIYIFPQLCVSFFAFHSVDSTAQISVAAKPRRRIYAPVFNCCIKPCCTSWRPPRVCGSIFGPLRRYNTLTSAYFCNGDIGLSEFAQAFIVEKFLLSILSAGAGSAVRMATTVANSMRPPC